MFSVHVCICKILSRQLIESAVAPGNSLSSLTEVVIPGMRYFMILRILKLIFTSFM